ncbi:Organic radical-activating enzymes like protein [Aduncisulcus paluster]|uniref:Organic radical-activating enzymes like protein n=1 Tax=Aduncisulcus paluster TaxID=2918883 RepID=A0ABQ5KSL0_9EUKA|nr:Organic radical-activating enzymes like protein [Aduncisulcus paluster]
MEISSYDVEEVVVERQEPKTKSLISTGDAAYVHSIERKETTVDHLMKDIERKKPFLKTYPGGVSVSGGDPLLQHKFVAKLFQRVHDIGLTTCIATSGIGSRASWESVIPHSDFAIVCVKHFDRDMYKKLARADGLDRSLQFIELCISRGVKVWLQYVLIPGYTTDDESLDLMVKYILKNKGNENFQRVELLPYHTLGKKKWKEMGLEYILEGVKPPSAVERKRCLKYVKEAVHGPGGENVSPTIVM